MATKKALCIGINNYPGTHMDLQGCVNDAQDWAETLSARGFAVTALLDDQATKAAMIRALSNMIGGATTGDSLVITFSGHGTYQPDTNGDEADGLDEGLCPYDIQIGGGALVDDEIYAIFSKRKPGIRLVLISDSCHSGTVTRAAPATDASDTRPRFMPMGNWMPPEALPTRRAGGAPVTTIAGATGTSPLLGALSRQEDDLLFAGCKEGPNNYSYDARINGRYNGAFTYHALKALKSLKPTATYADWQKAVAQYLPSSSYPQVPQLVGTAAAKSNKIFA